MPGRRKNPNEKVLKPVHPNRGIEAAYRRKLDALIQQMQVSTLYWIRAAYRERPPELAQDESPANFLRRKIKDLTARWLKNFETAAPKMAAWFAQTTEKRSADAMKKILKDAGFTVPFKMTPAMRDIADATIAENVSLIKSIPSQYFTEIEGLVMRSVQHGGDLKQLTDDLHARYDITRRRAKFIARDQNAKATSAFAAAKQVEAGITEAQWVHSEGGHHKRPTHVKASRDKVRYDIKEGWLDPALGKRIWPGSEPNCKCIGRPVIRGFL